MRYSETIAKLADMGHITDDRKQVISLEDVAMYQGDLLTGEMVKIYICDSDAAEFIDEALKKHNR
jgi:hypothetical protein